MKAHAETVNLKIIVDFSFDSTEYFVEKFPFLLTVKGG